MSATEVETRESEGARGHRAHHDRHSTRPYVGQWWIWFVAIPLLGTFGWYLGWQAPTWVIWRGHVEVTLAPGDESAARFMVLMVAIGAAALAGISVLMGLGHTRRKPTGPTERTGIALVVLHVAASWLFGGLLVDLIIIFGWSLIMLITVMAGGAVGAFGWNMYRADPFRADPRGEEDKGEDPFLDVVKLKGAKLGKPEITASHIEVGITPGRGGHPDDVLNAFERIEYAVPAALNDRGRVDVDSITGKIKMLFMHTDPLKPWPLWTGPTFPGGSFEQGAYSGRCEDGLPQLVKLAKHVDDEGNDVMPQHCGSCGATRTGKTGHVCVLWTDLVFTRRDVLPIYVDGAKPGQSLAGQLQDDLAAFAGSVLTAKRLFEVLQSEIVPFRSRILGEAGFRDWSHEAYLKTGLAALYVMCDEAFLVAGLAAFRDLAVTCLSVGIWLHPVMPRVDGESMDTTARTAISAWFLFGQGDDVSAGMVADSDVLKRGAGKVNKWGARKPGYHFLTGAGWVPEERHHLENRSLKAEFSELIPVIRSGRAYRAQWHPGEMEILIKRKVWQLVAPKRTAAATWNPVPGADWRPPGQRAAPSAPVPSPSAKTQTPTPAIAAPAVLSKGTSMIDEQTNTLLDPDTDPQDLKDWRRADPDEEIPLPAMADAEPGDMERFRAGHAALTVPVEPDAGDDDEGGEGLTWGNDKIEAPSRQAAYDEFDRALIALARRLFAQGEHEFASRDLIAEFRYKRSVGWYSTRLTKVVGGDIIVPAGAARGITLERVGEGRFAIVDVEPGVIPATEVDPEPYVPGSGRARSDDYTP